MGTIIAQFMLESHDLWTLMQITSRVATPTIWASRSRPGPSELAALRDDGLAKLYRKLAFANHYLFDTMVEKRNARSLNRVTLRRCARGCKSADESNLQLLVSSA